MGSDPVKDPFLRVLGETDPLPAAIEMLHSQAGRFSGRCQVERGRGWIVSVLLWLGRFPGSSADQPVSLNIEHTGTDWIWTRDFGGHKTVSHISWDASTNRVKEDIGHISIWLKPRFEAEQMHIEITRISVFGLSCPAFLLPRSDSVEFADNKGRFSFDISARVPGLGLLIRYKGWLTPDHVLPAPS